VICELSASVIVCFGCLNVIKDSLGQHTLTLYVRSVVTIAPFGHHKLLVVELLIHVSQSSARSQGSDGSNERIERDEVSAS